QPQQVRGRDAEAATADLLRLVYGDPDGLSPTARAQAVAEYRRRLEVPHAMRALAGSARGIVSAYTERGDQALWRQAEQVGAPVLLVYGLRDKLVSYRSARRACAAFADARLLVLPESGHVAMMEHPDAVARAVRELIGDAAGREGTADRNGTTG
ncbi:alpha/beta fold hydrolase, partial [Streptomyces sp. CBMA156]|uniref:alpha/beta fold hydrolase n=1 Tax=Streptomyces sp. CBMA156 TaxID=1930280 RepID=UPI0016621218